jgi:diketogulonate reductase-like aldo/keto reductase
MTHAATVIELPSGETMPVLGQGTWYLGERPARRQTSWPPCAPGSTWASP